MNKEKIIKSSEMYTSIINNGKSVKNRYFSIFYQAIDKNNKYGITIPKKIGKANVRNKIKRQIKNIIMTNEINIPNSYNYVIIIKEAILEINYNIMVKELLDLLKKVSN